MKFINQLSTFIVVLALGAFCAATPKQNPQLSMKHAKKIALARQPGHIKSAELEKEHGRLIYSFDIERNKKVHEVNVDANTGKVVEDTVESAAAEVNEQQHEKKAVAKHLL